MGLPVGDIVELVGPDRAVGFGFGQRFGEAAGVAHIIVRVLIGCRRHLYQLRPRQPDHVFLFLALGFGDDNHRLEPHRRTHQRQTDAGVACGAFDNGATRFQGATRHGVTDDVKRSTVLDRLSGVQKFRLAQYLAAGQFTGLFQPDQRGLSNGVCQVLVDAHRCPFPRLPPY